MEVIRAEEGHVIRNGESCEATEYLTLSPNLNIARIKISGRFPEAGVMWNTEVEEVVYVENGNGKVVIDEVETALKKGDVVHYKKSEKVFWEGQLTLIVACAPAWTVRQHVTEG